MYCKGSLRLKLFGRAKDQIKVIGRLSEEFKDSTLSIARSILISIGARLVSTISTALIASIFRKPCLDGEIAFFPAFFILLLAPEFVHRLDNWVLLSTRNGR